jgi:hypothetical protein
MQTGPPGSDWAATSCTHAEFDLLAACCAATWRPTDDGCLERRFGSSLNWERLLKTAEHHGLTSLLLERIEISSVPVPREKLDDLRSAYRKNAYRALWFAHELGRILENLRTAGVEVLAHKGAALSALLYGDVTQRQFHDLDFLVKPDDVSRMTAVLAAMDYECGVNLDPLEEKAYLHSGYERVFHSSHGKNLLEVQWRILPRFYAVDFDMEELFAKSQGVRIGSQVCRTLSNEHSLLTLCVHAAKHVWTQMSWLRDITQLANRCELDWEFIDCEANRLGIQRIVALNFLLADRIFGCGLPARFGKWRDDRATCALLPELLEIMRRGVCYKTESFAYFRLMLQLRERRRDRTRFLWRLALTPGMGEWRSVRLPGILFPMYSLVRVGRLAKRLSVAP